MSKNAKMLILIIGLLIVISTIAIVMNKEDVEEKSELNENAIFIIMEDDVEIASYNMSQIKEIGEKSIVATLDTSTSEPEDFEYTGVLLKNVFTHAGVSLVDKEAVIVAAVDGYTIAISMEKLMDEDNVYIVYKKEGELLGTREEGGKGPYQIIIIKDQFSQYWCKYALSANIR